MALASVVAAAVGTAGFVSGRMVGGGAYVDIAVASTYLIFAGTVGLAAYATTVANRARNPLYLQLLGLSLFLYGAIIVGFGFNRPAAIAGSILLVAIVAFGALGWRDLGTGWTKRSEPPAAAPPALRLTWSAVWIPIATVAAAYFALGDFSLTSSYVTRWLAVAVVLVAVVGRRYPWAAATSAVAAAAEAIYVTAVSTQQVAAGDTHRFAYVIAGLIVIGLAAMQGRQRLMRRPLIDPVHLIAAQLGVTVLFRWAYFLGSGLGLDPNTYATGTTATPFRAELPLLAMALAAVGLGLARPLRPAMQRFGVAVPHWWHVILALAVADAYLVLTRPVNLLTFWLMPDAYHRIGDILNKTDFGLPYWAFLAYALLAGICEESLFRGALQPRAGILVTAVLFAAIHVQYGLTPVLGLVFLAGIGYGVIRRQINLTTAVIAHAATDSGGFLLASDPRSNLLWAAVLGVVVAVDLGRRWIGRPAAVELPQKS